MREVERYQAALRPYLEKLGLTELRLSAQDGRLAVRAEPWAVLPVTLELTGYVPGERYYKASRVAGVTHGRLPEGQRGPTRRLDLLAELLVRLATPELVTALGPLRRRDPRLWNLDLADLVARGLKPAAIMNVENRKELLERAVARVPAAVWSTYPYIRNELDQLKWVKEGAREGQGHRLVYCAQDAATAQLLKELDWERYHAPTGVNIELQTRIGVILGYPECCAAAYEREVSDETELEDVRWLRAYVKAGEGRWPYSPWTNVVAARTAHMLFFEHLPCAPWCEATINQNRRMAEGMFGADALPWLESLLRTSFLFWPDGSYMPFLAGSLIDGVVPISQVGTAWSEGIIDRYRPRFCDGNGLLPLSPAEASALRQVDGGGWEIRGPDGWVGLGTGRAAPLVLLYPG